ncbi:werner syndrome atp-dependent helicase isoform x4 [Limosa lapponica baueri]|uniref:Werner syndrome atp-dependent helicase isoform x4 n=1 Tax=Limosa lapponica baueri TaxID=1758121 RepID=A0A2I0UFK8_LIMLA|nr:werner syndrome atp-dependent helicase isoform x4 [Limosa lapponica baueri]
MQPRMQLAFWSTSTHGQLMLSFLSTNTPKSFSSGLLSIHSLPKENCLGLPSPICRTLHLALLNFMRFALAHMPVQVPLDGIPSLQHVDCATQLGVDVKLAEDALYLTVHAIDKDVKQCLSQY